MQKGSFANEDVMEDYLTSLLTESVDQVKQQSVAKLLQEASPSAVESLENLEHKKPIVEVPPLTAPAEPIQEIAGQVDNSIEGANLNSAREAMAEAEFQALFFEVAGLTLAVPLTQLGGIHQIEKIEPLFGKPDWFMGIMLHRDEKLNAVDSAKWVMPGKYSEKLAESLKYQYLIMLDESGWGLACESLVTTTNLQPNDVKWRSVDSKRPWLAGMVKEKMCALIDVPQLIGMLHQGMGSND